jgi:3-phenylpropionate/trans-cinnamate dioxygenase ferredoxin reductase subunit
MNREQRPVVIVGAGHAGGRCAERLRHFGWRGRIVLVGDETVAPYERPPLSKAMLVAETEPAPSLVIDEAMLAELDIEHLPASVVQSIDRHRKSVVLDHGEEIEYQRLVLATGLTPRRLPAFGAFASRVHYLHTIDEARALRAAIRPGLDRLIVGAGFIGLEVAASARECGAEVTVIEAASRPLGRMLPARMSAWMAETHRKAGVRILCDRRIEAVGETSGRLCVTLAGGETLQPDLVVVGIGGIPNDGLARAAGLAVGNGIEVDGACLTSDPDIYAIGDVACHWNALYQRNWRLESWMNAEEMAANAARSICGEPSVGPTVPWFWTDQYDRKIQMVGLIEPEAEIYEQGPAGESGYLAYFVADGRLRGALGIDSNRAIRKAQQLIRNAGTITAEDLVAAGFAPPLETMDVMG